MGLEDSNPHLLRKNLEDPIVDQASSTVTYIGYAAVGSAENEAKWFIKRVTITGTITKIEYPQDPDTLKASNAYAFVWADRATITYIR